jgi:hypothetical protein
MHAFLRRLKRNAHFRRTVVGCLLTALWGFAPAVPAQSDIPALDPAASTFMRSPSDTDDWTRHLRVGALVGMNISAKFSMNGTFGVSGNNPAQGIFDDGYVRVDNTGDVGGGTTYWGYDNASQLNGTTLAMHAATSFSANSDTKADGGAFPGFELAYGDNISDWKHARIGWEAGFGLLPIKITDNSAMSATVNQSTYTFNVGNVIIPQAPYFGNPSGSSVVIPDTASATNQTLTAGTVTGTHALDVMLYTLRLGPTLDWDLSRRVGLSLGAGPAVGIVSGDYKYNEVITAGGVSANNSGKIGGTDFVYGGYANALVMYHVVDHGDIYAGVQFMPMSNATIGGGGREGQLNLTGQLYFSVGINCPF